MTIQKITVTKSVVIIETESQTAADSGLTIDVSTLFSAEDIEAIFRFVQDRMQQDQGIDDEK